MAFPSLGDKEPAGRWQSQEPFLLALNLRSLKLCRALKQELADVLDRCGPSSSSFKALGVGWGLTREFRGRPESTSL